MKNLFLKFPAALLIMVLSCGIFFACEPDLDPRCRSHSSRSIPGHEICDLRGKTDQCLPVGCSVHGQYLHCFVADFRLHPADRLSSQ